MTTFHDHFSGVANKYAGFRPHYPAALFDYLATLVPAKGTVWDCAAGTGQASVDLAERFAKVIATDGSAEQIKSATAHPRVEYRVALAETSGLADQSIDLITVGQALHWFNFERFYAEVNRVLRPGGVLAVWAYGINTVEDAAINERMQHYYAETVGSYWPPERAIVADGYRTIPFPFAEITPPVMRMEANWTLEQLLGYFSTWSATSRYLKAKGHNPLEPLAAELSPLWGGAETTRVVIWPLALRTGRKKI